ncbi:DUF2889 domain-containing protein [Azoarcus sp. KH32C]|uniref:DUF2889 domain-containing protein n=1 Tax=Azoarcus sp. KH32C TaxID=748247 RepID=UPI0002386A40|nr:DUF2889 domain-containing protein [Azoarcus sp. KH32C]BAL24296.1 hypothetical protein AZKH_1983 [Azoarcus sp. KH32C]
MSRQLLHARSVECRGYLCEDGEYEIEARLIDRKTADATMIDGRRLPAGEPWHEMMLTLRVDRNFVIRAAAATTIHAPVTPCSEIAPVYQRLVGLRIGRGFGARVRELFSGPAGCTHLTELIGPLATTAYQTITGHLLEGRSTQDWQRPEMRRFARSLVDSCHVWRGEGPTVQAHYADLAEDDPSA